MTVQEAPDGSLRTLFLLDAANGNVVKQFPNPDKLFYTYPKFYATNGTDRSGNSRSRNRLGQMSQALVDAGDGTQRFLLPFSFQPIGFPSVKADTIWFTASRDREDRVYALAGGRLFRAFLPHGDPITGQYEFHAGDDGRYTWNTFTAVGFHLDTARGVATGPGRPSDASAIRLESMSISEWPRALSTQGIDSLDQGPAHLLDRIGTGHYPATTYPITSHLINFHSWRPYINDPDYQLSLVSDNILNNLETDIYGDYNRNEQYKQVGVDATYGGLYPFLDAGWDYTFNRNALYGNQTVYWNEAEARAGFSIPLNWTSDLNYTSLQFGSDIVYNQRYYSGLYKDSFNSKGFAYIDPFISFVHQSQQAQAQIAPRFAEVLSLSYNDAVTTFEAHQFLASGFLYLPGLAYTHSLLLAARRFQQRDTLGNARFTNNFPFSRGYTAENFCTGCGQLLLANYQFPLW